MQTSLQAIADKARKLKEYKFRNLYGILNPFFLKQSWKELNKKSAPGIDKVTFIDYEKNLDENIDDLVATLKWKAYRAKLVKRVFIPKGNGKMRPLGIPATNDKLLQQGVRRILETIFEQDFLDCSYGYRPNKGSKDAIKALDNELQHGKYNYVVEADIKGFFDNISHDWMVKMLEQRIADTPFIRLIKKWLKAGILQPEGVVTKPTGGTPQGGIVSPVLANIYLHYVLDLWFEKVVKHNIKGQCFMIRYADDFVCAFQYKADAERFYDALPKRLGKFNLEVSKEKTKILSFSRFDDESETFDFLGFEFSWRTSKRKKRYIKLRTSRSKLRKSVEVVKEWLKKNIQTEVPVLIKKLNEKLRGYYKYYCVIGNYESLHEFYNEVVTALYKRLNRRSQRRSFNWSKFKKLLERHKLLKPSSIYRLLKYEQLVLL